MKITIESTQQIGTTDPANPGYRVWTGTTETGVAVYLFVSEIAVAENMDAGSYDQFEKDLTPRNPASLLTGLYARSYI